MNCIIIDDDKLSRRVVEEFVTKTEGLVLINSYENAVDAINAFNEEADIDLIFLDIEMPNENGFDLLNKYKDINFKVIFVTAYDAYALKAIKYSALDYLLKPVDKRELIAAVEKLDALESQKAQL